MKRHVQLHEHAEWAELRAKEDVSAELDELAQNAEFMRAFGSDRMLMKQAVLAARESMSRRAAAALTEFRIKLFKHARAGTVGVLRSQYIDLTDLSRESSESLATRMQSRTVDAVLAVQKLFGIAASSDIERVKWRDRAMFALSEAKELRKRLHGSESTEAQAPTMLDEVMRQRSVRDVLNDGQGPKRAAQTVVGEILGISPGAVRQIGESLAAKGFDDAGTRRRRRRLPS